MTAPRSGIPDWVAAQASPWNQVNRGRRILDAFCLRTSISDRDLTAPPGTCADGARYLVAAGATGAWAGQDGKLAIANGANAASGWNFATVAQSGVEIWVEDEDVVIEHDGANWTATPAGAARLVDMSDVLTSNLADSFMPIWDESNQTWYFGPDQTPSAASFRGALVKKASDQTTANYSTPAVVAFDSEVYDTDAFHDNVTNNSRFTIPAGVTKVRLTATVRLEAFASGNVMWARILKGGSFDYVGAAGQYQIMSGTGLTIFQLNVASPILDVAAGEYFELQLYSQDTSVTVNSTVTTYAIEVIE